MFNVKYKLI